MRTLRRLLPPLLLLTSVRFAEAQAVRFDSVASTTSAQCASGKICPLNAIPGATVNICGGSVSTLASCLSSPATTYTSAAASTPCATTSQLTPATGGACRATSDNQGGYGFWIVPGSYNYFLRVPATAGGGTYGPYPISIGASAGCPLGATCDANYNTLALACAAAGTGTLYVTRAWSATPTQSLGCNLEFLGNGRIQAGVSQTITITAGVTAPFKQQIFDQLSGGLFVFSTKISAIYDRWWGTSSISPACAAAADTGVPVQVTTAWTNVPSMTCSGPLNFTTAGSIQPASAAFFSTRGYTALSRQVIWDLSNSGSSIRIGSPATGQLLYAANFSTFAGACATAATYGSMLSVQVPITGLTTQTCSANITVEGSGSMQPTSGSKVTLAGSIRAGAYQILDHSAGGTFLIKPQNASVPVEWCGAAGDGSTDDLAAIQNCVNDNVFYNSSVYIPQNPVKLACKTYKITNSLNLYGSSPLAEFEGFWLQGCSKQETIIAFNGPTSTAAIYSIGGFAKMTDFQVEDLGTGWSSGISYNGNVAIGRSTEAAIRDVWINCNGQPGDGLDVDISNQQADTLSVDHIFISYCFSGVGVNLLGPNALSINLYNPTIISSWIGIKGSANSTNMGVFGGEIDVNTVNFWPGLGGTWVISGVRSEESARILYSTPGSANQNVILDGYLSPEAYDLRPATVTTATSGAGIITITETPIGGAFSGIHYAPGDYIVIAGAGVASAALHTVITASSAPGTITISPGISTSVTGAAITMDTVSASTPQDQLIEAQLGPYIHRNCEFGGFTSGATNIQTASFNPRASQIFTGNAWIGLGTLIHGPYGNTQITQGTQLSGNVVDVTALNGGPFHMFEWNGSAPAVYVPALTGTSNAATVAAPAANTGFLYPPVTSLGLIVTGQLSATLRAGANTFTYPNGGTAYNILSSYNPGLNIGTAYNSNGFISLFCVPAGCVDLKQ